MSEQTNEIKTWAVVEIMGHQQVIGFCTTQTFGGTVVLRVDVPDLPADEDDEGGGRCSWPAQPGRTQYIGMGSIYRLSPCDEDFARKALNRHRRMTTRPQKLTTALPPPDSDQDDASDEFEERDF